MYNALKMIQRAVSTVDVIGLSLTLGQSAVDAEGSPFVQCSTVDTAGCPCIRARYN